MSKFAIVFVLAAIMVIVQGFPTRENDIASAAAAGHWDEVHRLLAENHTQRQDWKPLSADVRNLRADNGGHVYGEAEFTYHTSSNINGRKTEQSAGHKVINNDGRIVEYDFKP